MFTGEMSDQGFLLNNHLRLSAVYLKVIQLVAVDKVHDDLLVVIHVINGIPLTRIQQWQSRRGSSGGGSCPCSM